MKEMKIVDTGIYNKDNELYAKLSKDVYERHPGGITLPPEYAQFAENNLLQFLIRLARYKFVARMMKETDKVLEIGSGSGLGSIFIGQYCKSITGIEIKKSEVEEARSINKRKNVEFRELDFFNMEKADQYDVIVAMDVIEHLMPDLGQKMVEKTRHHISDNGLLIVGTPSIYSYEYQGQLSRASHVKCYDQKELMRMIEIYYNRVIAFSMNDEVIHTGHPKMAWYYIIMAFYPQRF